MTPARQRVLDKLYLPDKLIARELGIATTTVKVHVSLILRELGVANRTQAALTVAREEIASLKAQIAWKEGEYMRNTMS